VPREKLLAESGAHERGEARAAFAGEPIEGGAIARLGAPDKVLLDVRWLHDRPHLIQESDLEGRSGREISENRSTRRPTVFKRAKAEQSTRPTSVPSTPPGVPYPPMRIRAGGFIPNLCTLGNGVCGFAAIVKLLKVQLVQGPGGAITFDRPELFAEAAAFILWGMVFDVFDGKLARRFGNASDLGAQLDSLCDLTTFGLAPALLVVRLNMLSDGLWQKIVWFFSLAYFVGAALRLARFNAENEPDESAHLCFKGLPSPAAAGCVASLVIFHQYIMAFQERELQWLGTIVSKEAVQGAFSWIPSALPALVLALGYTMVSTHLKYTHVATQIFHRRQSFEFLVTLTFGIILAWVVREVILPVIFIGYLAYTPLRGLLRKIGRPPPPTPPEGTLEGEHTSAEGLPSRVSD